MAAAISRRFVACILAACALPAAAQTNPEIFLQQFQGTWTGSGSARLGPDAPWEENATCTIEIEWRGELRSHGVCEGGRGRFSAGGAMSADGSGDFMVPFFVDVAAAGASINGNAIVAGYTIEDISFRLTVTTDGRGTMQMRTEMEGAAGWAEVARLTLTAQ